MRHGLFTDAVTRFNEGQSPLQNEQVLAKIIDEIQKTTDARVASPLFDMAAFDLAANNLNTVQTTVAFINERLGSDLSAEEIRRMLENVEFTVELKANSELVVTAPFWRMDIAIAEDIVEEVGRINGYDRLPVVLPARNSKPAAKNTLRIFKQSLRDQLAALGANEVLGYSFVHGDLLRATGTDPDQWAYHLRNAISPELQYYRTSLTPNLLQKVQPNIRAQAGTNDNQFALFEIGKAHVKGQEEPDSGLPIEFERLAFVIAADKKSADQYDGSAYYQAKLYLDQIANHSVRFEPIDDFSFPITSAYASGRSAVVLMNDQAVGVIGEYNEKAKKYLKLPEYCAGFEIDIERLLKDQAKRTYMPLSIYPSNTQDITLEADESVVWREIYNLVHAEIAVAAAEDNLTYTVEALDIFKPADSDKRRHSFRVTMTHNRKTLTTDMVSSVLEHVANVASSSLNATRI